jgi:hypothetical protein
MQPGRRSGPPRVHDRGARRAYPGGAGCSPGPGPRREVELSEHAGSSGPPVEPEDAVLLFVGGPLDGRVEIRAARHGDPLPTVTHVHLHDGPKVVHRYDLESLEGQAGVYHLRQPAQRTVRDEASAD